jgi:2,3-dihydroxy-p-cumate/2,3-dihydroxybenzoate 3,4-dioxygenase
VNGSPDRGCRIEIAWRPAVSSVRYRGTRDAGITGFSHIGLCTTDAARDEAFWTQACNARRARYSGVQVVGGNRGL